jgi:ribose 5-phosphate isomerase B
MKIAIGNDHAGPAYKQAIVDHLTQAGHHVINCGTDTLDSVDYPDFAHAVAKKVVAQEVDFGIVICGSAQGVSMTVNKYAEVRGAVCWNKEIVQLARQHNNANVLCLPARFTAIPQCIGMVDEFLATDFEGGRHDRRVQKIACS